SPFAAWHHLLENRCPAAGRTGGHGCCTGFLSSTRVVTVCCWATDSSSCWPPFARVKTPLSRRVVSDRTSRPAHVFNRRGPLASSAWTAAAVTWNGSRAAAAGGE